MNKKEWVDINQERFKNAISYMGLTQKSFAEDILKIHRQNLNYYLRNEKMPVDVFKRCQTILHCAPEWLTGDSDRDNMGLADSIIITEDLLLRLCLRLQRAKNNLTDAERRECLGRILDTINTCLSDHAASVPGWEPLDVAEILQTQSVHVKRELE